MFKSKKSDFDEVLDPLPLEVRKIVIKTVLPYDVALAWFEDSGIKFCANDVLTMANALVARLPN